MSKFLNIKPKLIVLSIVLLVVIMLISTELLSQPSSNLKFGITFSPSYATYLDLDWKDSYDLILNDLEVKRLRLPTYWREVEPVDNKFNFADTDYLLDQANKNGAEVLLVVGMKQPRWPECQIPDWARQLTVNDRQKQVLNLVETVVTRYKNHPSIHAWQVENEPMFGFGENCDPSDRNFLQQEVELVRSLDPKRPIVITDTGEWRFWTTPMQLSNILGISVYRYASIKGYGFLYYPFPKLFYQAKSGLVRRFFAPNNQKTIITELQTEAWSVKSLKDTTIGEQIKLLSLQQFKDNINFAKNTGFDEIYLWGVEWWIYLSRHNHPEYLEYAKTIL